MDTELRELLERLHDKYNRPEFIECDPISVPHRYAGRTDREIAGFFAATIAWGNRKAIVANGHRMMRSIEKGAACKRLCMYLRWMVRSDGRGVDFGEWTRIPMSALYIPLDVHTGNMSRALGLLTRRQNDWRAVEQTTASLRMFDPADPVRYDFSLFGAGIDGYLKA